MSSRTVTFWRVEITTPDDPHDHFDMYECGTKRTAIKHAIKMLKHHRAFHSDCYARLLHIQHTEISEERISETEDGK